MKSPSSGNEKAKMTLLTHGRSPQRAKIANIGKSTKAKRGIDMRFEVDIGTRIESAMYAMYDGRRRCQPPSKTPIIRKVKAISSVCVATICELEAWSILP